MCPVWWRLPMPLRTWQASMEYAALSDNCRLVGIRSEPISAVHFGLTYRTDIGIHPQE